MNKIIYYISKPGEERSFATTKEPSPYWAGCLKEEGYKIFRVTIDLPDDWDSADFSIEGKATCLKKLDTV